MIDEKLYTDMQGGSVSIQEILEDELQFAAPLEDQLQFAGRADAYFYTNNDSQVLAATTGWLQQCFGERMKKIGPDGTELLHPWNISLRGVRTTSDGREMRVFGKSVRELLQYDEDDLKKVRLRGVINSENLNSFRAYMKNPYVPGFYNRQGFVQPSRPVVIGHLLGRSEEPLYFNTQATIQLKSAAHAYHRSSGRFHNHFRGLVRCRNNMDKANINRANSFGAPVFEVVNKSPEQALREGINDEMKATASGSSGVDNGVYHGGGVKRRFTMVPVLFRRKDSSITISEDFQDGKMYLRNADVEMFAALIVDQIPCQWL